MDPRINSLFGLFCILMLAYLLSKDRKKVCFRTVAAGILLQFLFAFFALKSNVGKNILTAIKDFVLIIIEQSDYGARFVFGDHFQEHFFAFKVLPTIIFVSSLFYLLTYWGIIQKIVAVLSFIMSKTMRVSGVESLVAAINVFVGQTEAPMVIRPYLAVMTKSEINVMMTAGMATVSGGVFAAYIGFGISAIHLISASLMAAPTAILIAKIIYPETENPQTLGTSIAQIKVADVNAFEAICNGAAEGLKLALNVAAMLIVFVSLVALINVVLGQFGEIGGHKLTFELLLGYLFRPLAFLIGVSWSECGIVGQLIGEKVVLNEFIAYLHLGEYMKAGMLSERTVMLATYALCGFANFSSIGMQVGGIGALAPSRKKDLASIGLRALLGGVLTNLMTACVAGILVI